MAIFRTLALGMGLSFLLDGLELERGAAFVIGGHFSSGSSSSFLVIRTLGIFYRNR